MFLFGMLFFYVCLLFWGCMEDVFFFFFIEGGDLVGKVLFVNLLFLFFFFFMIKGLEDVNKEFIFLFVGGVLLLMIFLGFMLLGIGFVLLVEVLEFFIVIFVGFLFLMSWECMLGEFCL